MRKYRIGVIVIAVAAVVVGVVSVAFSGDDSSTVGSTEVPSDWTEYDAVLWGVVVDAIDERERMVESLTWREVGSRVGLSHEGARKRFHSTIGRRPQTTIPHSSPVPSIDPEGSTPTTTCAIPPRSMTSCRVQRCIHSGRQIGGWRARAVVG